MEAEIARRFRDGELAPSESVREIKHIGPYLGARLRDAFNPRARELTTYMSRVLNQRDNTSLLEQDQVREHHTYLNFDATS